MIRSIFASLLLTASVAAAAAPDSLSDENAQLRQENERLKAQIEALQKGAGNRVETPAAALPAPVAPATAPAASASPPAAVVPAAPATPPAPAATANIPLPTPPPGYKLVPLPPPSEAYVDTGCTHGWLGTTTDGDWKIAGNWQALRKGMRMPEVEQLLGVEHYDVKSAIRTGWQYGKCGDDSQGVVVFERGVVLFWKAPDV